MPMGGNLYSPSPSPQVVLHAIDWDYSQGKIVTLNVTLNWYWFQQKQADRAVKKSEKWKVSLTIPKILTAAQKIWNFIALLLSVAIQYISRSRQSLLTLLTLDKGAFNNETLLRLTVALLHQQVHFLDFQDFQIYEVNKFVSVKGYKIDRLKFRFNRVVFCNTPD